MRIDELQEPNFPGGGNDKPEMNLGSQSSDIPELSGG